MGRTTQQFGRRRLTASDQQSGSSGGGGGIETSATNKKWEHYDFATDCATSDYPRLIHPPETWQFLQDAYIKSLGSDVGFNNGGSGTRKHGFSIPFDVRDDGPRGRSIYAAELIPKGTKFYDSSACVYFDKESYLTDYLRLLPHDLQCDILLWTWANTHGAELCLDEGSYMNHGEKPELRTHHNTKALRDLQPGEELLEDYSVYVHTDEGWFNELRGRSWGEMEETGGAEIEKYTSQGAPEVPQQEQEQAVSGNGQGVPDGKGKTRTVRGHHDESNVNDNVVHLTLPYYSEKSKHGGRFTFVPQMLFVALLVGLFWKRCWLSFLRNKEKRGV